MPLEGVPLYIANDKARHGGAASRALIHASYSGVEGVLSPTSLKIEEADTPDNFVTIRPGGYAAVARGVNQELQMYEGVALTGGQLTIPATDSSGGRSDLIVVQVEDPGDGTGQWSQPADPVNGPYEFIRRIPNVPPGTTSIHDLEGDIGPRTAVDLARLDIPVSTGTIEQSMIVELRRLANPHRDYQQDSKRHSDTLIETAQATGDKFPFPVENGEFTVFVPEFATKMDARFDIITVTAESTASPANMWGNNHISINDIDNVVGFSEWNQDWNGGQVRFNMSALASDVDMTPYQGQFITLISNVSFQGGTGGNIHEDNGTTTLVQVYFTEESI